MLAPVVIGAVGGPFGVHGWVHVKSFTAPADNLLSYQPWQLRLGSEWRLVDAEARAHRTNFVACIDGCADRDAAAALSGAEIGVSPEVFPAPAPDEYYWRDLVGCRVVGQDGDLGRVARVFATPAHDVLVVECAHGDEMIPFVRALVSAVDIAAKHIVVDWQASES